MRVLGTSFAKKSETKDSSVEFLAEVLRRNPQDETPHVTLMDGDEPSLGVFAAIVATELTSKRFNTLAQVAREYGCSQMKLIDAFKALQDSDLLELAETDGKPPRSFAKSKPSALLSRVLRSQGFRLGAVEQMDAELFGKALAEFDVQIKKSLGVPSDGDCLQKPEDMPISQDLDDDSFAALCTVLSRRSKNVPVVGLGRGIEVSPTAFVLLHEINKGSSRLKDIPAVADAYDIPAPTLYSTFERLISAGLVTGNEAVEAGSPSFASCMLSENARRTLDGRRVATALGVVLFSSEAGLPVVSRDTYSLLELTHAGLSLNSSVASESLRSSRGTASRYLASMEQAGLLTPRSGSTYDANTLAKRVLSGKSFASLDSVQWLNDRQVLETVQAILEKTNVARSTLSLDAQVEIAEGAFKHKRDKNSEEISAALDRAVKSDVQRISNHLINLASKRNRQVFYSSELGFIPGKMSEEPKSDLSIRREAVKYLFTSGFLSFEEDFSDALANGIKPELYQPSVRLHPLGDKPNSDFNAFDQAREDYSHFRRMSYLRSFGSTSVPVAALCEQNGFDEDDLRDFLNDKREATLASLVWALDSKSGRLVPGVQLANNAILARSPMQTPALDYLSMNSPCSARTLLTALGLQSEEEVLRRESLRMLEKNGVVTRLIDETKYESTRYVLASESEDFLKAAVKKTQKDIATGLKRVMGEPNKPSGAFGSNTQALALNFSAPESLLAALSVGGVVRVKDVYSGNVGFHKGSEEKPTEKYLDRLASTGALKRYKSRTGALDYLVAPEGLGGLEGLIEHVEACLVGQGKTLSKSQWKMPFAEFAKKVQACGYEIPKEDSHAYNMAASVHAVQPLSYRKAVDITYGAPEKTASLRFG